MTMRLFWVMAVLTLWWPGRPSAGEPQAVKFPTGFDGGTAIGGLLVAPDGDGPFPAVVMLHGCSGLWTKSGKLRRRPAFWSQYLSARGYLVLMADSFRPRGLGSLCSVRERPVLPNRERPFDAYGALAFLQARSDVDPARVALIGWSNGAMTMLWTVMEEASARPAGLTHDFRAAVGFYPGCTAVLRRGFATRIPTLLQLGGADDWTPAKPCLRLVAKAKKARIPIDADVYPGAYHNFDHPSAPIRALVTRNSVYATGEKRVHSGADPVARDTAIERVTAFFAAHLQGR
jgi:dienelactone hydrolase